MVDLGEEGRGLTGTDDQASVERIRGEPRTVIFHRAEMFYMLDLPLFDDLSAHAECNPGTIRITDAVTGEILWMTQ